MSDLIKSHETTAHGSCLFIEEAPAVRDIVASKNQQAGQDGQELVSTLVIFHRGDAYPGLERLLASWPHRSLQSFIVRLNRFHQDRANTRSLDYMKEAINSRIGSLDLAQTHDLSNLSAVNLSEFEQIIILWPDANGMGWFKIEQQVFKAKKAAAPVYVLNGRKRLFELSRALWRQYRLRRFLEKSFLLEIGVLVLFLVTAPALALWDTILEPRRRHK
jgi:hypothetical protein